jgi:hypothetical protein
LGIERGCAVRIGQIHDRRINVLEGADPHTVLPGPVKIKTGTHGKVDGCGKLSVRDLRVQTGTHGSVSNIMITKQAMLEAARQSTREREI